MLSSQDDFSPTSKLQRLLAESRQMVTDLELSTLLPISSEALSSSARNVRAHCPCDPVRALWVLPGASECRHLPVLITSLSGKPTSCSTLYVLYLVFLLQIVLPILGPLQVHSNFRIILSVFKKYTLMW